MALRGNIEQADRQGVRGWIRDEDDPDRPVSLLVTVDDQPATRVLANTYRVDLEQAGIGNGRFAFALKLEGLSPLLPHRIQVVREADGAPLPGTPVTVPASTTFQEEVRDYLATMVADVEDDAALAERASFLAQQSDRLLQRRADRRSGVAERAAQRHFRARWAAGRDAAPLPSRSPRALVIDDTMPQSDRDAGSCAIISHMQSLRRLGYDVAFAPADMRGGPAVAALQDSGVVCYCAPWTGSVEEVLRREAGGFALVYIHRGGNARYQPLIRHYQPRARIVYSVADLHHLRLERQADIEQRPELREFSQRVRAAELAAAQFVDAVITHSTFEAALLQGALPSARVHVVPWSVPPQPTAVPFHRRSGMAFIGGFDHPPNLDAVWWLVQEVFPLVRAKDASIECMLVGSNLPDSLRAASGGGINPVGHVPDLAGVFDQIRLTVAPLTFGAGVKGKVLDSFAAGIPCACTPMAAEGLDLPDSLQGTIANGAEALAGVILRLHADAAWNAACSEAGLAYVRETLSEQRLDALMREVVLPRAG
jgi:glycosyltransferase involved in cell wall biosynthesis